MDDTEGNGIVSADGVDEFRQLIPAATVLDVAGAAHMVAGDDNAVFLDRLIEFLNACSSENGICFSMIACAWFDRVV